jgi:4-carboxymuconolactone decarboxylase
MADNNPTEHVATGREYLDVSQGPERAEEVLAYMNEFHPELGDFVTEHALDAIYTRPGLTLQQRQLITVASLVTQGDTGTNLSNHLHASLNLGITEDELREALLQLTVYAGMPRAINAMGLLRDVLADREAHPGGVGR